MDAAGALTFDTPEGARTVRADATVLALGGASWPRLGADGGWGAVLEEAGFSVSPFAPANMGVLLEWSAHLSTRFAGAPLKRIALECEGISVRGEAVITRQGLEGGAIYALSRHIRTAVERDGQAWVAIDLRPDVAEAALAQRLADAPSRLSFSERLRKAGGLSPVQIALLHEGMGERPASPLALARRIKALPLMVTGVCGLERAISSAGGLRWSQVAADYALMARPDVFVCARCWTGRPPRAAICCRPASPLPWPPPKA